MNIGRVSRGYHFMSFIAGREGHLAPSLAPEQEGGDDRGPRPIAAKTRCPVMSISIIEANMRSAIIS